MSLRKKTFGLMIISMCVASCQHNASLSSHSNEIQVDDIYQFCLKHQFYATPSVEKSLQCAHLALDKHLDAVAEPVLESLRKTSLNLEQSHHAQILQAQLAIHQNKTNQAAKILRKIKPTQLPPSLQHRWLQLEAKISQHNRHWGKALEFTLSDSSQSPSVEQLWQLAQKSHAKEPSFQAKSKSAQAWLELASIVSHYDGFESHFAASLATWKQNHPQHEGNSLFINEQEDYHKSALSLCFESNTDASLDEFNEGVLKAFYKEPSSIRSKLYWENSKEVTHCQSRITLTDSKNNWNIHDPAIQNSWPGDEEKQVVQIMHKHGRSHPLVLYEKTQQRVIPPILKALQNASMTVVTQFAFETQPDHTLGIKTLLGIQDAKERHQQIEKATWEKTRLIASRRHDFDSVLLISSYEEAAKIIPLLQFFYANDAPIFLVPTNHLSQKSILKDLAPAWILDRPSDARSAILSAYGHDAYQLAKRQHLLQQYPMLSIEGETGTLRMKDHHPEIKRHWSKATKHGLRAF